MLSKLPKISKEQIFTALIIFAAFTFRTVFALTQTSHFVAKHIIYLLIAFVPFAILITSKLSDDFRKNFKAGDIAAIIVIMYALTVVLDDTVIRYSILTAIGVVSGSLLLCQNIYLLPVVAILNLISVFFPQLGSSAVVAIPATMCFSFAYFSFIFEKTKTPSKKNGKKSGNSMPAPNYKKEKIIFAISEIILFAAIVIMAYSRRYSIHTDNFRANIKYIIPILIPAVFFVIFAVLTIKSKKSLVGVVGYFIAIAAMPLSQLCGDYSVAAVGTLTAFTLLLVLCNSKLTSGKYVDEFYGNTVAKIGKSNKATKE